MVSVNTKAAIMQSISTSYFSRLYVAANRESDNLSSPIPPCNASAGFGPATVNLGRIFARYTKLETDITGFSNK